jgi:phosphatidylserine/phosphatidylglycerophosphate/cardiolipin synthase-like enzyme
VHARIIAGAMSDFSSSKSTNGFSMKVWRGERMCLIGFDVDQPEDDLVGFAIEVKRPGAAAFTPLRNRLAFKYDKPAEKAVTGDKQFPSTGAPFQKFPWVHFPQEILDGTYTYRGTKMHMKADDKPLVAGTSIELPISLEPITYANFLDIGFTRNFASSQAYVEQFKNADDVIPGQGEDGLTFTKKAAKAYEWLGFEAHHLLFTFLKDAVADPGIEIDAFAYDLDEPDIVAAFKKLGTRLRIIIDNSITKDKSGNQKGHGLTSSDESKAADALKAAHAQVRRAHFQGLQHHKVLIAKRNGVAFKVLVGSTNFSFRGLYIQANNMLVFDNADVAGFFGKVFEAVFGTTAGFSGNDLAKTWHAVTLPDLPNIHIAFSPHSNANLSLNPVRGAVDQATSSVFYSVAFLNQIKSGPTKAAFDRLMTRPVFSYGIVDKSGGMEIRKPDGSIGLVDFAYLSENAPPPFKAEWAAGQGINIHHKFVVTDFSLPSAKVFTGSSNLAPTGEEGNGDHLIQIDDMRVATSYAIEAVRVFDHLHFRDLLKEAKAAKKKPASATPPRPLTLRKPKKISGDPFAWFDGYYVKNSQRERDRTLFAR